MKTILVASLALSLAGFSFANDKENTAVNDRDKDRTTLTPEDQSNSPEDLKITQAIRQALVRDKNLSMTAKNIKVITVGGAVTLRGPVKSLDEKTAVDKLAQEAAPGAKLTSELEVSDDSHASK